jgi:hypothetical protein
MEVAAFFLKNLRRLFVRVAQFRFAQKVDLSVRKADE